MIPELNELFRSACYKLVGNSILPDIDWKDWTFKKPMNQKFGDLISADIIKRASKYTKETGQPIIKQAWADLIIKEVMNFSLPHEILSISAKNGFINISLHSEVPQSLPEDPFKVNILFSSSL